MLSKKELMEVSGGASKWAFAGIVGGIIAFLSGFLDGLQRPLSCNK